MKKLILLFTILITASMAYGQLAVPDSVTTDSISPTEYRIIEYFGTRFDGVTYDSATAAQELAKKVYNNEKLRVLAARSVRDYAKLEAIYGDINSGIQAITGLNYPKYLTGASSIAGQLQSRYTGDYTVTYGPATVYIRVSAPDSAQVLGVVQEIDGIGGNVVGVPTYGPGTWFNASDESFIINGFFNTVIPNQTRLIATSDEATSYFADYDFGLDDNVNNDDYELLLTKGN